MVGDAFVRILKEKKLAVIKAHKAEESPYRSINELSDKWVKYGHEVSSILIRNVIKVTGISLRKASEDAPLIFKGRIQYNPRTGKPITSAEWKRLEEAIVKYLGVEKDAISRKMINDSFWLGTLINRMNDETERIETSLSKIDLDNPSFEEYGYNNYDLDRIEIAQQLAGIYLQNISDKARGAIQSILVEGIKQRKTNYQVAQDLWDQEQDINRDLDRVVRTESAYATQDGLLISQLRQEPEEEDIFMIGVSSPDACRYCQNLINEKVVVLRDKPVSSGKITVDGVEYDVIWPGKSNYGRSVKNYWPTVPVHPFCRCTWTRWYRELEQYIGGKRT